MKVVVVGSANLDLVATAPALPRPGETVLGRDFSQVPGGKGANQAIAAVRAGAAATFIGAIGSDAFGVTLRARLVASAVDSSLVRVVYGGSGVALIVVDDTGENMIVVAPGANAALTSLTEPDLAAIAGADVLLLQLEIPVETVTAAAQAARSTGIRVVLNAAPARALPDALAASVDLLVVNQVEAAALAPLTPVGVDEVLDPADADPWTLVEALLEQVPRVVLTLSAAGASLAVGWGEGRPLVDAVRWASAAGAAAARRLGASSALPDRAEIDDLYRLTYPHD